MSSGIIILLLVVLYYSIDAYLKSKEPKPFYKPAKPREDYLQPKFNHITREDKKDYMSSLEWRNLRWAVLTRDGFKCKCGSRIELEVHHITYDRWRREALSDLVTLCRSCHQERHDRTGYSHNSEH